jgi:hypothetical protein
MAIKLKHLTSGARQVTIGHCLGDFHRLEIAKDSWPLSSDENWLRREVKRHCLVLASLERTITRLCSRIRVLKDGDANTTLFHRIVGFQKQKNSSPS